MQQIEPIAICGIGLRLPGGIHNGDEFWQLLVNGRDARREIPSSRFTIDGFDDSLLGQKAIHTKHGYFIDDDLTRLDTSFFSMSRKEIERCDPQQRLLLEVVRECFEDAGEVNYRGQPIGCYVGTFGQDWYEMVTKDVNSMGNYAMMGCGDLVLANRVSYEFDLHGPSMVVKTGCSASLVALHDACRALQSGDASAAVVCGTSLIMTPTMTAIFFGEGVLSPDASCKTFDAAANGFARAEGITAVYIKRLDDALRDGNPIRAVIRNTGSNNDGRSKGLMSPNGLAHEALMRRVYQQADLHPSETAFVECHGTGTPIGDPIEARAVGNVFGDRGVYIGSVKPNVGHSEGCSGLTSLIKAVLALEKRTIPPNINFLKPNPHIPFTEKKLTVPLEPTAFPRDRAERVSVNSFGIGGSNAHVIVESTSQFLHGARAGMNGTNRVNGTNGLDGTTMTPRPELLLFSANSPTSLNRQIRSFQEFAAQKPEVVKDIAYTLALHRERLPHRAFAIIQDGKLLEASTQTKAPTSAPRITMVFSGQGAQWPRMGRQLISTSSSFRQDIIFMDRILQGLRIPPKWSIIDELIKPEESSHVHRAELAQPLSTALQIALVRLFQRLGIKPSAVVGHSSGEIAAAYAAGHISLEYAMVIAYYRGYVTSRGSMAPSGGAMAAVGLGAVEVSHFLQQGACVACENSPSSTTISGDAKAVQRTLASVLEVYPEVMARPLKVDMAYHSHHMVALAAEYLDLLQGEDGLNSCGTIHDKSDVRFYSSVTTRLIKDGTPLASPYYWVINLVSPVRFSNAVCNLLLENKAAGDSSILLEVGPHSALAGPLRQICEAAAQPCNYVPSQIRGKDCAASFLSALGKLYQEAVSVDWKPLFPEDSRALAGLPTYPWDHSAGPFWYESRLSSAWRTRRYPDHCLLGARVVESPDTAPQWRNLLNLEHVPWLGHHKIHQDVVFPFAGYVAMAGEAVRQVTGCKTGYHLRRVVARTALVLTEAEPVEVVTTLRRQRLTDTDDSTWFDFVVASYSGSTWVKHCEGQAMPLDQVPVQTLTAPAETLSRRVTKIRFYDAVARAGLVFGPEFQRLTNISTSVTDGFASAKIDVTDSEATQPFPGPLHPASIDACIQLLLVANVRGLCRELRQLVVPTLIENIEISHGSGNMHITALCPAQGLGSAEVEGLTDGNRVFLRMSGLQVTMLENDSGSPTTADPLDVHAAAHLHWLPDFDSTVSHDLIKPPAHNPTERKLNERLTLLCILESADQLANLTPSQPHFAKYRDWLNQQVSLVKSGSYPLVHDAQFYINLDQFARRALIESTYAQILALPEPTITLHSTNTIKSHAAARGIKRVSEHAAAVFRGERDALDLLLHDGLLTHIYAANETAFDYGPFARRLARGRAGPGLRVLEVGAGTGGTTAQLLPHLLVATNTGDDEGEEGGVMKVPGYREYMFTDVSAGFFPQAKERFRDAPNMKFRALDISRDPVSQGFAAGSYDLIVAPNVVHATPCLRETLANLRVLLKENGMLLLTEVSTETRMPNFVFGNFAGWWLGEEDGRVWEPYVLPERWDAELKAAGFTGVDAVVPDAEMPWQMCVVMLSKSRAEEPKTAKQNVTVLCQNPTKDPASYLISGLENEGLNVTPCQLGNVLPNDQDIISCIDLETRFFDHDTLTEAAFYSFQTLLHKFKDKDNKILWLTPPFQVKCRDPRGAQALGVMRTIRAELGLPLFTLELDVEREAPHAARLIAEVFTKKVQRARDDDMLNADREFAIDNGTLHVGRYLPFSLTHAQTLSSCTQSANEGETVAKTLRIRQPGDLSSLVWKTTPLPSTLPSDHVQVKVHSGALNFRDILLATGSLRMPTTPSVTGSNSSSSNTRELGLEASGVITRTNSRHFRPGDRVILVSPTSTLTTELTVPSSLVVRVPDNMAAPLLSPLAAAPVCFATALHALMDVGRLRPGMSVLVHSACGGVGLAALEICRSIALIGNSGGRGVEVYATVGSKEKVEFLLQRYPELIRRERIFSSRDGQFRDGVMRATCGKGVDLVLNSLSGELLHASWGCVADYGIMVELGKRDLVGAGRLDMAPFLKNRTYAGVDLYEYMRERPDKVGDSLTRLLARYVDMYEQGVLRLPDPVTYFRADQAEQAFRHLQNGAHIGKVVINMPDDPSIIKSLPPANSIELDPNATYLLVGGSKGLGASMASWLVEQGAKSLTILSRSAGVSSESKALLEELRSIGCSVHAVAGSVENREDVDKAISCARRPVKGVFQLAMAMNDTPLLDMTWSQWNATLGPKVRGTWNLHEALANEPLDFFWMASSIVTVVDEPGQANYSAGCNFLEAFCQYRHSLCLPATVLNICPIEGVGYVAENPQARRNMKAQGLCLLGEPEFLDFVRLNLVQAGLRSTSDHGNGSYVNPNGWKNPSQVIMGLRSGSELPLDDPNNRTNWRRDRRMGLYHNMRQHMDDQPSSSTPDRIMLFLDTVTNADVTAVSKLLSNPDNVAFIARQVGKKIHELIMKPVNEGEAVDTDLTLIQIGLDSLMAIELRRWLRGVFGITISVLEIMGSGSLLQLGEIIAGKLAERLSNESR
ncbi:polyketide synthase [Corynascus similis CBS 632.67]